MKRLNLLFCSLLLAGCTVQNQARYMISPAGASVAAQREAAAADKDNVKEILQTAAKSLRLNDMTASSLVPNTLVYFQQIDSNTPVKLIAWTEGGKILIDLAHWPDTIGETLSYRSAREYIESELKKRFGDRSSVVAFRSLAGRPSNSQGVAEKH
jgi:hypothetical protein